jgi:hypothetical protein
MLNVARRDWRHHLALLPWRDRFAFMFVTRSNGPLRPFHMNGLTINDLRVG